MWRDLSRLVDVECKEESCNSVPYSRRGGAGDINIHMLKYVPDL